MPHQYIAKNNCASALIALIVWVLFPLRGNATALATPASRQENQLTFSAAQAPARSVLNSAPVVTTTAGTTAFVEGKNSASIPVRVDTGLRLTDPDNSTLASAVVSISTNFSAGQDILSFTSTSGITGSYDALTGILSLTSAGATATLAQWQVVLRSVTYTNSSDTPATATRTLSFLAEDGTAASQPATRQVSVRAVNDTPQLTASTGTVTFTEDDAPLILDSGLTITDVDNTTLASATVEVTALFPNEQYVLALASGSAVGNITSTYSATTGVLTLSSVGATATLAQWQSALRSVTYFTAYELPRTVPRTATFIVNDGGENSAPATKTVTLVGVNDTPVITAPASIVIPPVSPGMAEALSDISVRDLDSDTNPVSLTLTVGAGTLIAQGLSGSGTATLTGSGPVSQLSRLFAAYAVAYIPPHNNPASVPLTITLDDNGYSGRDPGLTGTATTEVASVTINLLINQPNTAPTLPIDTDPSGNTVAENAPTGTPVGLTVRATDPEGTAVTYALINTAGGRFAIDVNTGVVTVANGALLDYEAATTHQITVRAYDRGGLSSTQVFTIQVTDVVENPPAVVQVAVPATGLYGNGQVLAFTVTFDAPMIVATTAGTPSFALTIGSATRQAVYAAGSGTTRLVFRYAVAPSDLDTTGVGVGAAITLNGGTIRNTTGTDATLTLNAVASTAGVWVDGRVVVAPPTLTALTPTPNLRHAASTSVVTATFSQSLNPGSTAALRVFSSQRGGLRTGHSGTTTRNGATLTFTPTAYAWQAGETVWATVTKTAQTLTNQALVQPKVFQFTVAAAGSGRGNFRAGSNVGLGTQPSGMAVGDVDGDGDLDFVVGDLYGGAVKVRLNGGNASGTNTGVFSGTQTVALGAVVRNVALADVDGDGDLDLLSTLPNESAVDISLNGGNASGSNTGLFSNGSRVAVNGDAYNLVLGDVDGDGDLDLVTSDTYNGQVSVRLNGGNATGSGTGIFSGSQTVMVGFSCQGVALGDVDGDGDLDLLATGAAATSGIVAVRLNGGNGSGSNTGVFSGTQNVPVGAYPSSVVVGDVDGDGDLDLVTSNLNAGTVSVRLNGGNASGSNTGLFSGTQDVAVARNPMDVKLADVDGDGDLDLLAADVWQAGATYPNNEVTVRLNGGDATGSNTGLFSNGAAPSVGASPASMALGDVDGDGDIDLLTANFYSQTVSVRFNQPPAPTVLSFTPSSGQVGTLITVTGTQFTGATTVTINGVVAPVFSILSSTSLTVTVPAAATSGVLAVTTPGGTGTSTAAFTVLPPNPLPVVATLTPASVVAGGPTLLLTVEGSAFISSSVAYFNGAPLTTTVVSPTQLTATLPAAALSVAGAYAVTVRTPAPGGGTSAPVMFTVTPATPILTSFAPAAAPVGATVTLTGQNFTGVTAITFNGVPAVFTIVSSTTIMVVVPATSQVSNSIAITNAGGTTTSGTFFTLVLASRQPQVPGLALYPNPVGSVLTIAVSAPIKLHQVAVRDALGRVVLSLQQLSANGQLDVHQLPAGIYLLELHTTAGEVVTRRLVKQ